MAIAVAPEIAVVEGPRRAQELRIDVPVAAAQPRFRDHVADAIGVGLAALDESLPRVEDVALVTGAREGFAEGKGGQE